MTAAEMTALDRATIEGRGVPSLVLMERAGKGAAREIAAWWREVARPPAARRRAPARGAARGTARRRVADVPRAVILAWRGNNGGDGFVCARYLKLLGFDPRVLVAAGAGELSADAQANHDACVKARIPVAFFPEAAAWEPGGPAALSAAEAYVLIDALLGTGSRGAPHGAIARAIDCANHQGEPIVAIDIPSGLDASTGHLESPSIAATLTTTLALPKRGHVIEPGRSRSGDVRVVDIGIHEDLVEAEAPGLHRREVHQLRRA